MNKQKNVTYKEHLYIEHVLEKLDDTSKTYAVIGKEPLFKKGDIETRKLLTESNLNDAVILKSSEGPKSSTNTNDTMVLV